jgi:hypothetical protein
MIENARYLRFIDGTLDASRYQLCQLLPTDLNTKERL